jgi:GntR family transcriptional regulator, transcriptional repressor for pyruvate dehydrogenase complex
MLKKLSRTPVVEEALGVIKDLISQKSVGDKLPTENMLVENLGVSRQTVREVLITLQAEGYIEIKRGKGAYIIDQEKFNREKFIEWVQTNQFKIQELVEMRMAIEPYIASLAAEKITKEEIIQLCHINDSLVESIATKHVDHIVDKDEQFHYQLVKACRNSGLTFMYESLVSSLREYRKKAFSPPANPKLVANAHNKIISAIKKGDSKIAYQAMVNHIMESHDDILGTVNTLTNSNKAVNDSKLF